MEAYVAAVTIWMIECPTFEAPKQSTKYANSEYPEELDAYFDKEDEHVARVYAYGEKTVLEIHTLLLQHCYPVLDFY